MFGAAMIGGVIGGLVWATPIFDLAAPVLATGNILTNINAYGIANPPAGPYGVELKTIGPSQILVQDVAYSPGGHTGWHSHPGVLTVVLISGTLDWYDGNCKPVSYKAGDAWTEGSQLHYVQSTGTVNSHFTVTYIIPKGTAYRIDEAAPACAAAGLAGVTGLLAVKVGCMRRGLGLWEIANVKKVSVYFAVNGSITALDFHGTCKYCLTWMRTWSRLTSLLQPNDINDDYICALT